MNRHERSGRSLGAGRRRIAATMAGLWIVLLSVSVSAQGVDRSVDPRAGGGRGSREVELRIRVWAAVGDTAFPIRGALVWLRRADARPDGSGAVLIADMQQPGAYHVVVERSAPYDAHVVAMGFAPVNRHVRVRDGDAELSVHMTPAPVPLEELVTRVDAERTIGSAGHTVHRIDLGEGASPSTTLADWLGRLPGVEVRERGRGGPQTVSVRGSRPEAVLVLLDGLPLNDPLTGAADLSGLPAGSLASATVVHGALAGGGSGASAGLVSLSTRAVALGTSAGLTAGSFGHIAADLSTGSSGRLGTLSVGARLESARNDYTFENRVSPGHPLEERRNADRRDAHVTIAGRLRHLPLRMVGRIDALERGSPGRMGTRLFDDARWSEVSGRLSLSAESEGGSALSVGYAYRRQRYTDPRIDRAESLGARQVRLQGTWRPGVSLPWRLAGYAGNERVDGAVLERPTGRWIAGLTATAALGSPALEVTPALSVDVAGRHAAVSPALSVAGQFAEGWRVWARAGQAYRVPTFADLYLASSYQVRPNPELRPERVEVDAELGLEWGPGRVRARAGGFFRRTTDAIVWLPSSTAVWSARNAAGLTAVGAEAEVKLSPGTGWEVDLGGTWTRSRVSFGPERTVLPYQPEWSGAVVVTKASGPRRALVRIRYTGPRPTSLAATHELPAHALVDVSGGQTIRMGGADLEIDLGVMNLLGARYELVELFPEPGRELTFRVGIRTRPQPGLPSDRWAENIHN